MDFLNIDYDKFGGMVQMEVSIASQKTGLTVKALDSQFSLLELLNYLLFLIGLLIVSVLVLLKQVSLPYLLHMLSRLAVAVGFSWSLPQM